MPVVLRENFASPRKKYSDSQLSFMVPDEQMQVSTPGGK